MTKKFIDYTIMTTLKNFTLFRNLNYQKIKKKLHRYNTIPPMWRY